MAQTTHPPRTDPAAPGTDRSRRDSGRRRLWVVVAVVLAVVLLVAGGYVLWDRSWRTAGPANPRPDCPAVVPAGDGRPLAMPGVDRVMLIGDSIMDQASCAIGESLSELGVETHRNAIGGTGLLGGPGDWVASTRQLVTEVRPDVVVVIFVGNYLSQATDASGRRIVIDSPEFFGAWQQRAEELSRVVRASGARLYWVSPPPIAQPPLNHARRLYEGYRTIEGDHFLDAGESLAGDEGKEVSATITCGRRRTIRTIDGTHLTPDGARIYGQTIAHQLSADLGVLTAPRPC